MSHEAPTHACGCTDTCDLPQPVAVTAAATLKAVADPTRLRLLHLIRTSPDGEACVCQLLEHIDLTQPTVSHHLKVLTNAGLLQRERRGTWVWYRFQQGPLAKAIQALS